MDFEKLQELVEQKNASALKKELVEMNEYDIASFLSDFKDDRLIRIFRLLPKEMATDVFVNLDDDVQMRLITSLTNKEATSIIEEMYSDDDDFTIFCWPEVQDLMLHEDFYNNAVLMNEPWAMNEYGSQTYLVSKAWLKGLE